MKNLKQIILLCTFLIGTQLTAQNINRTGTSAAQFLKFGVGARATALGEAGVTLSDDMSCVYWNPATIARLDKLTFGVSRNELYADISYSFVGVSYPLGKDRAIGFSAIFLNSGEMEVTTLDEPQGTGDMFSWESFALGFTYSQYITDRLSLGASVKYVREGAYRQTAQAFAIDIGSLLDTGVLGMKLGMSLSNLGQEMQLSGSSLKIDHEWNPDHTDPVSTPAYLETDQWPLPLIFRLGLSTELIGPNGQLLESAENKILVAADTFDPNDALLRSNFGVEFTWHDMLALRFGYRGISLEEDSYNSYITASYAAGAGLKYQFDFAAMIIDYSYLDYKILGNGHQFSMTLSF